MKSPSAALILLLNFISFVVSSQAISDLSNPDRWQYFSQRSELNAKASIYKSILYDNKPTLALEGNGKESVNGCWFTTVDVEASSWYAFHASYIDQNVEEPYRSVLARILWYNRDKKQVGRAEYPASKQGETSSSWKSFQHLYQVPEGATKARIELILRWDEDGKVNFGGISFQKTDAPEKRLVRLASVHHRPRNSSGPEENLKQFAEYIRQAAEQDADIVCLPEGATLVGTGLNYISASEPIPGPTTEFMGKVAKDQNLYIVVGMLEREGETVYNTSVLIDRQGAVAGKYRKVSLPREEIEGGVTPGDGFPVFETDFGTVGMMICWDVTFPEAARTLAFNGAEVIFLPIWGGHVKLAQARALENQVYLVSSTYGMKTAVFDLEGEIAAEATEEDPVIVVEVDLNERKFWPWLGDLKNRIRREMPPKNATTYRDD